MSKLQNIKIRQLGRTVTGKTPSSNYPEDFGAKYMFITPSDNFDSKKIGFTERSLSDIGFEKLKNKGLPPNSILITCIGSAMGKVALNSDWAISNQQINALIPEENFDNDYLYYVLKNNYKLFRNAALGSTALPMLNKTDFDELEIMIHEDLPTQKKIASVLSSLDAKIELNNRINAELEAMAKTLYDYWFVQFDFPNAEGKPYKSSGGAMVWNEELKREIPEGWRVGELKDMISLLIRGISPKYIDKDGIIVLNQRCIRDKSINPKFGRRHDYLSKNVDSKLIAKGDILVNSTGVGTLGRAAIVKDLPEELTTVDSHVTIVRIDETKANPLFTGYNLLQKEKEIEALGEGSTGQTELSRENLGKLKLILPEDNLQESFASFLEPLYQKIATNEQENQQLAQLRDWLLPMLMNGQVVVE